MLASLFQSRLQKGFLTQTMKHSQTLANCMQFKLADFFNVADDLEQSRFKILIKPIQLIQALADSVINTAGAAKSHTQECKQLKFKTQKLKTLLLDQAFHTSTSTFNIYKHPTHRILNHTAEVVNQILNIVCECRFPCTEIQSNPAVEFPKMMSRLEDCMANISWLLDIHKCRYSGMPPIAAHQPELGLIWEQIAILHNGMLEDQSHAAAMLALLARENREFRRLIVEEGGLGALERLRQEGTVEGREKAAEALRCIVGEAL